MITIITILAKPSRIVYSSNLHLCCCCRRRHWLSCLGAIVFLLCLHLSSALHCNALSQTDDRPMIATPERSHSTRITEDDALKLTLPAITSVKCCWVVGWLVSEEEFFLVSPTDATVRKNGVANRTRDTAIGWLGCTCAIGAFYSLLWGKPFSTRLPHHLCRCYSS